MKEANYLSSGYSQQEVASSHSTTTVAQVVSELQAGHGLMPQRLAADVT